MTPDDTSKLTDQRASSRSRVLREAARRGIPGWASPTTDKLLQPSIGLRLTGLVGAAVITAAILASVLWLLGFSL